MNKTFVKIGKVFLYTMGVIPIISVCVVLFWYFDRELRGTSFKKYGNWIYAVFISAFITLYIIISSGIENLFVFIPADWGSVDEYGEWESVRSGVGFFLGLWVSIFIAYVFSKYEELLDEVKCLKEKKKGKFKR